MADEMSIEPLAFSQDFFAAFVTHDLAFAEEALVTPFLLN